MQEYIKCRFTKLNSNTNSLVTAYQLQLPTCDSFSSPWYIEEVSNKSEITEMKYSGSIEGTRESGE